jgi:hypothetical protein
VAARLPVDGNGRRARSGRTAATRRRGAALTGNGARLEQGDVRLASMEWAAPDTETQRRRRSALGPASRRLGRAWRSGALGMVRAASVALQGVEQELEKLMSRGGSRSLLEPRAQGGERGGCPHAGGGDLVPQVGERGTHPRGGGVDALEARAEEEDAATVKSNAPRAALGIAVRAAARCSGQQWRGGFGPRRARTGAGRTRAEA